MCTRPASRRMARWCETVGWVTSILPARSPTEIQQQQHSLMIFWRVSSAMALAKRTGFAFIDVYLFEIISKFVYLSRVTRLLTQMIIHTIVESVDDNQG